MALMCHHPLVGKEEMIQIKVDTWDGSYPFLKTSFDKEKVTAQPEGIGGVVFGGAAPKNHTPAHPYAGRLSSYRKIIYVIR